MATSKNFELFSSKRSSVRSMWDSNDYVKFAAKVLIFINILVGLLFVGYGLYVVFLPWGDAESYQALGICLTLFGLAFTCGSIFGYLSVDYQLKRFGGGWTGRSAIVFYDFLLVVLLVALVLAYIYGNGWLSDVKSAVDELYTNPTSSPSYSMPEKVIRDHFNKLYFTASDSCKDEYGWFWAFIDDICPSGMSEANCQSCGYGATFCRAEEYNCYAGTAAPPGQSFACPYVICREGYLRWLNRTANKYFHPVIYACWGITVVIIVLSLFLICYNQTKRLVIKATESPKEDRANFVGTNPAITTQPVLVQPLAILEVTTTKESASTISTAPRKETPPPLDPAPFVRPARIGTVAVPPALTLSNKSIDLDTENAIIDSFIAMSRDEGPGPGVVPSINVPKEHRSQSRKQNNENYAVSRSSHQEGVHVSSHGGTVAMDAYAYDLHEESYERGSRRNYNDAPLREYEPQRVVERSSRHNYNQHQAPKQHDFFTRPTSRVPVVNDDVELEIAIMESIQSTQHGSRPHAHQAQSQQAYQTLSTNSAHGTHRSPRAPSTHRTQPQYTAPQDQMMYQPLPISPGGADVELEIAMMESLATQSHEDEDVARAIFASVQPKKKPLGIPTQMMATPTNRSAPRYETGSSADSELDQAIIQSILNKK